MSRKRRAPKRIVLTDTKYKSNLILKFMNSIMYDGKKTIAEKIVYEALDKLQLYFVTYPEGQFIEEANVMATELGQKLEKKAYEIAKQYHHTENYKPAIEAFDNYLVDYPGSSYREKAIYYKFESAYLLAINSYDYLVEERLLVAKSYLDNYFKYYQDGELSVKANELKADIEERLQEYS